MHHSKVLALFVCVWAMFSAPVYAADAPKGEPHWIYEEILNQLTALKSDVTALRAEVADLKQMAANRSPILTQSGVSLESDLRVGASTATIAVMEFSDIQCPYCQQFTQVTFPKIKEKYIDSGKLLYVFRDFPLDFHPQAMGAAVAARCGAAQNKLLEVRSALFNGVKQLSTPFYVKVAQSLGLDQEQFERCLVDPKVAQAVDKDHEIGVNAGVSGTPKFLVGKIDNGELVDSITISGSQSFAVFERAFAKLQ